MSYFNYKDIIECQEGIDVLGKKVKIGNPILFLGSNGNLIKGWVQRICKNPVDDTSRRKVEITKQYHYEYYYMIRTEGKRNTEKNWREVILIDSEV